MTTISLEKQLDLRKNIVLDLKKKKGIENIKAQVILSLDFSGSMDRLYSNGAVQSLVERLLPLGLAFDDNGEVDFYLFDDKCNKLRENLTINNINGYINSKIIGKYSMGGTHYAPVITKIVEDFGSFTEQSSSGFLGFGKKTTKKYNKLSMPVFVIMITDGENSDISASEEAISEAAKAGIFFQFVGIGKSSFPFLEKLDNLSNRVIDNAGFFKVDDLSNKTDEQLYTLLLNEFPGFVIQAKAKGLIA